MNGLKTTISILLQFLFLLFRVFGEHFCFAMGQCHGDFSQSTAQFLKLVGRQRVFRHTHSPRFLSKSIVARYPSVSYLNTGNGMSGGHVPPRMDFISDCCRGEVSPAMLALTNLMIRPNKL